MLTSDAFQGSFAAMEHSAGRALGSAIRSAMPYSYRKVGRVDKKGYRVVGVR